MSRFETQFKEIFGEDLKREKYKFVPHSFTGKVVGKSYCVKCGLVALRNEFSQWSVKVGCYGDVHPQYENKRKSIKAKS